MFLNCLLLASTRALSRARSMSVDALMMRYSMLSKAVAALSQTITLTSNDSYSVQKQNK